MRPAPHALSDTAKGVLGLGFGSALLGTLGVFVEMAQLPPAAIVFFRCLFGGVTMAGYCAYRGYFRRSHAPWRQWALAVVSGLLVIANWVAFFAAIQHTGIAVATVVFHVQPMWVVLLGPLVFGERFRASNLLWVGTAVVGLALAVGVSLHGLSGDANYLLGIGEALLASVLYTGVTIIAKGLKGIAPHVLTLVQCAVGVAVLPLVVPLGRLSLGAAQLGWLVGLGAIHTGLAYVLIYGALGKLRTPLIAALLFIYPVTAVLVDYWVFGHALRASQLLGLVVIVAAGAGISLSLPARRGITPPLGES